MRKWLLFAAIASSSTFAFAQSAIDGVWKTDPKTVTGADKPARYVLDEHEYRCESCAPKVKVPADGKEHPLPGNRYVDKLAARIVDDHTFEVASRAGKTSTVGRMTVSADGKSMVREIVVHEANGTTSQSTETLSRIGPAPRRGHLVSGTWRFATLVKMTDETVTFKSAAGTLSMNGSDGSGYDAPLDGTKVPVRNSPGYDEVSVTSRSGVTWEETSYAGGKPVWVTTFTVAPDGASMKVKWDDKLRGSKGRFTMIRQ